MPTNRTGWRTTGRVQLLQFFTPPALSGPLAISSSLTHCVDFAHDKPLFSDVAVVLHSPRLSQEGLRSQFFRRGNNGQAQSTGETQDRSG